jgi:hypothetical protein
VAKPRPAKSPVFGTFTEADRRYDGVQVAEDLTWDVLQAHGLAWARRRGDFRYIVLRQLAAGDEPTRADLAAALEQSVPLVETVKLPADCRPPRLSDDEFRANLDQAFAVAEAAVARDTQTILAYVAKHYVREQPRRAGRRRASEQPTITPDTRRAIVFDYFAALVCYRAATDGDARAPKDIAARARADVQAKYPGLPLSDSTIKDIVKGKRLAGGQK